MSLATDKLVLVISPVDLGPDRELAGRIPVLGADLAVGIVLVCLLEKIEPSGAEAVVVIPVTPAVVEAA